MFESLEWLIDAHDCDPLALADLPAVKRVCDRAVRELGLHIVGQPHWHQFPSPGGVTGLYLLSESHLTCHTFPEHGSATFNLYCCRPLDAWDWSQRLAEMLAARQVQVRTIVRGLSCENDADLHTVGRCIDPTAVGPRGTRL